MKYSVIMWLLITLKVTEKKDFALSLENTFSEKQQRTFLDKHFWRNLFLAAKLCQAQLLNGICSNNALFDRKCKKLENWLLKRG